MPDTNTHTHLSLSRSDNRQAKMLFPRDWEHSRARHPCWLKTICVTEIIVKEMFKTPCKYSSISLAWHENVAWLWHHAQASNHKLELRIYMLADRFYSTVQDLIQQFHTLRFLMKGSRVRFFQWWKEVYLFRNCKKEWFYLRFFKFNVPLVLYSGTFQRETLYFWLHYKYMAVIVNLEI